jgi:hypothetical protein
MNIKTLFYLEFDNILVEKKSQQNHPFFHIEKIDILVEKICYVFLSFSM